MSAAKTDNPTLDYFRGGVSAAISKTIMAPFDRSHIIYQTQSANPKIAPDLGYKGVINTLKRIPKEEGFWALWRGNFPNLIRYFPTEALNLLLKDTYKKIFCPFNHNTDFWKFLLGNLASGAAAGGTSLLFVYPLDFARARLAVDVGREVTERQFKGSVDCLKQIYKSDGVKGLYKGLGPALLGVVAYRGLYFGGYDTFKRLTFADGKITILHKFIVAQFITLGATLVTYPLDTVRKMLMMQSGRTDALFTGMIDCFRKIYQNEGARGFYRGLIFRGGFNMSASFAIVLHDEMSYYMNNESL